MSSKLSTTHKACFEESFCYTHNDENDAAADDNNDDDDGGGGGAHKSQ